MRALLSPSLLARMPVTWQPTIGRLPTLNVSAVLALFAFAACAAIWTFAANYLHQERDRTLLEARLTAASYVRAVEEHAVRTFQAADQTVRFFKYEVETFGSNINIASYLQSGIVLGDIFNLVSIVDEHGDVTGSSQEFKRINLSDREHIRFHFEQDTDQLFISKPVKGRVSGKWSIQMTRRANKPDGSLLGVVIISMDPFYFTRFYEQIEPGTHTLVALLGDDGIVRARSVGNEGSLAQDVSGGAVFQTIQRGGKEGFIDASSSLDERARLFAYRKIAGYPLVAIVAIDEKEALAPFNRAKANTLSWAIAATLFILVFAVVMNLLTRRLDRSRRLALAASEAKSDFLANMSHELRTPLHGILGYAELLSEEPSTPEGTQYVGAIRRSGQHLLNLVNDVLDLGRIEAGRFEATNTTFDLRAFVAEVASAHRSSASLKHIELILNVEAAVPVLLTCDEMKLKQILNNLVHNAIKFTERGTVRFEVTAADHALQFRVRDSGCGIPASALERIFEKFQQADSSLARSHEGTGLGLALVKQLSALVGATVVVESRLGEGSCFTVTLPIKDSAVEQGTLQ